MSDVDEMLALLKALANAEHDDFSVVDEAVHEIKVLCGANDWLRAEIARLVKEVEHWREARRTALLAGDVLKAENERLRADAERYRHIRSNINAVQALVRPDAVPRLVGGELEELGRYCDECIDNVMRSSGRVSDE